MVPADNYQALTLRIRRAGGEYWSIRSGTTNVYIVTNVAVSDVCPVKSAGALAEGAGLLDDWQERHCPVRTTRGWRLPREEPVEEKRYYRIGIAPSNTTQDDVIEAVQDCGFVVRSMMAEEETQAAPGNPGTFRPSRRLWTIKWGRPRGDDAQLTRADAERVYWRLLMGPSCGPRGHDMPTTQRATPPPSRHKAAYLAPGFVDDDPFRDVP